MYSCLKELFIKGIMVPIADIAELILNDLPEETKQQDQCLLKGLL